MWGAAQLSLLVQLATQASPSQVDGLHATGAPGTQVPSPSQRLAVTTASRPSQRAGRQTVSAG
jgi:hypothetical protein